MTACILFLLAALAPGSASAREWTLSLPACRVTVRGPIAPLPDPDMARAKKAAGLKLDTAEQYALNAAQGESAFVHLRNTQDRLSWFALKVEPDRDAGACGGSFSHLVIVTVAGHELAPVEIDVTSRIVLGIPRPSADQLFPRRDVENYSDVCIPLPGSGRVGFLLAAFPLVREEQVQAIEYRECSGEQDW